MIDVTKIRVHKVIENGEECLGISDEEYDALAAHLDNLRPGHKELIDDCIGWALDNAEERRMTFCEMAEESMRFMAYMRNN